MQYVCDAPNGKAWFRIETEGEAARESQLMSHTVEKYFRRERERMVDAWRAQRQPAYTAERALRDLMVIELVGQSMTLGQSVDTITSDLIAS